MLCTVVQLSCECVCERVVELIGRERQTIRGVVFHLSFIG